MMASRFDIALAKEGLAVPESGALAVYRALPDFDYAALPNDRLHLFNGFRPAFDRLTDLGHRTAAAPDRGDKFAFGLVHVTRSKQETLGLIGQALENMAPGGLLVVDGARTDGIDSVFKHVKEVLPIAGSLAKHHGRLFWVHRPATIDPRLIKWREGLQATQNSDGYLTAPGMFSPAKADPGSTMLAAHFDTRLKGRCADLGAGWGWLAAAALASGGITGIDLFEAEASALEAARQNLNDPRATFHWADVETLAATQPYDSVICNPPFHQGRAATPALGLRFIAKAAEILTPKGSLWLVANRQLPYEAGLERHFAHWQVLEETQYFKAILATRPRSKPLQAGPRKPMRTPRGRHPKRG